jgi:hypothetical protein
VVRDRELDAEERVRLAVPLLFERGDWRPLLLPRPFELALELVDLELDDFARVLRDDEADFGFVELPPERRFVLALSGDITLLPIRVCPRP